MPNYTQEFLHERGLNLTAETVDPFQDDDDVPDQGRDESLAGAMGALVVAEGVDDSGRPGGPELMVRTHNTMSLDCATIDSYQGREKGLAFLFSTVSASSGPQLVANPNRLCVAFTRMRKGLIVVGDLDSRTVKKMEVTEDRQHSDHQGLQRALGLVPEELPRGGVELAVCLD